MMDEQLLSLLECPACHGELSWTIEICNKSHIEQAEARYASCNAVYPVQEGMFLTPDLPRHDLWEKGEGDLSAYLRRRTSVTVATMIR